MNRYLHHHILLASVLTLLLCMVAWRARADSPVVRAVLFYSPSCGHCHKVITEDLPPLFEKYGDRLQIIGVNIADAGGNMLFNAIGDKFDIPAENRGVPLLAVADLVLVGSLDIPQKFPGLIEQYLAVGGVDWPDIPGLAEAIARVEAAPTATPVVAGPIIPTPVVAGPLKPTPIAAGPSTAILAPTLIPTIAATPTRPAPTPTPGILMTGRTSDTFGARFDRDPVGNGVAVVVLAGMVAAWGWILAQRPWRVWGQRAHVSGSPHDRSAAHPMGWTVPLLSLIGLGVAGYLAYVETQQVQAVCGPVGDCNSVQQSEYALLFGLIPIGVLGVIGYLAILVTWAVQRFSTGRIGQWARLALWAMAAGGVLFSIYLTFLEPFVIGATCAWCLSSAVIMTLLLLLTTAHVSGTRTWDELGGSEGAQQTS